MANSKKPDFLGRGWAFPVSQQAGKVQLLQGDSDIAAAIYLILATPIGQRVMRPDWGSELDQLVFDPANESTLALASTYAKRALKKWEPRITVDTVVAAIDGSNRNCILIDINYTVRATDVPNNLVYPFYLKT